MWQAWALGKKLQIYRKTRDQMLSLWKEGTHCTPMPAYGKRQRGRPDPSSRGPAATECSNLIEHTSTHRSHQLHKSSLHAGHNQQPQSGSITGLRSILLSDTSGLRSTNCRKYASIEKECLAIVWAVWKLRHYLIGAHFTLETDHKLLEWLESAGASRVRSQHLENWSLELRAYDFTVVYKCGETKQNADAHLRRPVTLVAVHPPIEATDIVRAQREDPVLSVVFHQLESKDTPPATGDWLKYPLKRYRQIRPQLTLQHYSTCHKVRSPTLEVDKLLFIIPMSQQASFLRMAHDQSGHQGVDRTLARLSKMTYWAGMAHDVICHCRYCRRCQITKAAETMPAPLQPVIDSQPREMVAVDILKVPISSRENQYILVAQDYFSKWPFAQAIQDQKADTTVKILKDEIFSLVEEVTLRPRMEL